MKPLVFLGSGVSLPTFGDAGSLANLTEALFEEPWARTTSGTWLAKEPSPTDEKPPCQEFLLRMRKRVEDYYFDQRGSDATSQLREEIARLYKLGVECSRMNLWLAAHDLISAYVRPNVGSKWKADSREVSDEADLKRWLGMVHDDEFPLGTFHLNLRRKLSQHV